MPLVAICGLTGGARSSPSIVSKFDAARDPKCVADCPDLNRLRIRSHFVA